MPDTHTPDHASSTITLAGGCFWCIDAVFRRTRGVRHVESGYSNGHAANPSYEAVCGGQTGHAEVVQVQFDPAELSLQQVLEIFFTVHDPTTLNRQGNDVGTQYRSGIYWHTLAQEAEVRAWVQAQRDSGRYAQPIVTELAPLQNYHPAEAYHQAYFEHNPHAGYCAFVVAPKVGKFQKAFPALDRSQKG